MIRVRDGIVGLTLAGAMALPACSGGGGTSTPSDAGSGAPPDALSDAGGGTNPDAFVDSPTGAESDTPPSCVPAIPHVAWTSPYAGWSRGIPTDPSFFPIAVWLQGGQRAMEYAPLGINIFLGNNAGTNALSASDLATLKGLGMYAIVGQDSAGLPNINDPTIIGWWLADEPDNAQPNGTGGYGPPISPSTVLTWYNTDKTGDPTRPVYLGLGQGVAYDNYEGRGSNPPPESGYVPASDIIGFDIYPYNNCGGDTNSQVTCAEFWLNAFGVDRLHMWSNRGQAVWTDFETTNIGSNNSSTPVQTVSEVWLALIHSANGVIYFVHSFYPSFREDGIFENPAMVSAVTALNQQIKSLAPELNSANIPNLVTVTSASTMTPIDVMVKANGSSLYVFSAASRHETTTCSFVVNGMTGNAVATVVGENRSVTVTGGKFTDAFAENGVHIYVLDLSKATCN